MSTDAFETWFASEMVKYRDDGDMIRALLRAKENMRTGFRAGLASSHDTAALNWIERQHLEELGMGLVIDAPNDGQYYVCGDSGTTHYGKTLREALGKALAEGA